MASGMKCKCGFQFSGGGEYRNCEGFVLHGESGVKCPECGKSYINGEEIVILDKNGKEVKNEL